MTYNELCDAILTAKEEMLKFKIEANSVTLNGRKYGKLIESCQPNMKPTVFGMTAKADYALPDDYDFLVQYEPPHPQTNADRIRQLSDEELAQLFMDSYGYAPWCDMDSESWCELEGGCRPCCEKWLKAPVEEVDK